MPRLVKSVEETQNAIRKFNEILPHSPQLAARLGQAHAFYVLERPSDEPLFGFSKFIGYHGLTGASYLRDYKTLDGRNTEHVLASWYEEVRYGSPAYRRLLDQLTDWMGGYGKRPRSGTSQKTRIMVLRSNLAAAAPDAEDRHLLNLLIAVADTLPAHQRHELRARL